MLASSTQCAVLARSHGICLGPKFCNIKTSLFIISNSLELHQRYILALGRRSWSAANKRSYKRRPKFVPVTASEFAFHFSAFGSLCLVRTGNLNVKEIKLLRFSFWVPFSYRDVSSLIVCQFLYVKCSITARSISRLLFLTASLVPQPILALLPVLSGVFVMSRCQFQSALNNI